MDSDIHQEAISEWTKRDELYKELSIGYHGVPEIRHAEKVHYLGEFRERVIRLLTKAQVAEPAVYPEIVESLKDRRATKVVASGDINDHAVEKYRLLAGKMGKAFTVVHDPALQGNAGLVVVSNDAVDIEDIEVPDRKTRLAGLGIPFSLANAAGKKVCDKCYKKITGASPEEAVNYSVLTLTDRFWGDHCAACAKNH
ncbi:YueI family protein [Desulfallas thermosapovorans]|uniref:Uncharacterized protein YueI n=1 Tax=Desulfallas thermosapovorans DSM 6562 TaxID=1121431 RepID=A0A5S4ZWZ5_9FIRM|nr:YueI family protein [Desulfallas thermosapovorans]TYO97213.1 uncharacterized protein YueI [Desulfallas thermosapovorans DSM 6562]